MNSIFFNAQHSPIGAFASFTLGAKGAKGGLAAELGKPADQNILIGLEDDGPSTGSFSCLPFFSSILDQSTQYDVTAGEAKKACTLRAFPDDAISREFTPGRDSWKAGDLSFTIHTPVCPAPDPALGDLEAQKLAYVPALAVEITVDNRHGQKARRVFFGFHANEPYRGMRRLDETSGGAFAGLANGPVAIATDSPGVYSAQGFTPEQILAEKLAANRAWGLCPVGLLIGEIPPGQIVTLRFAVCFHVSGIVTTGLPASYFYFRFFQDIEAVAAYSLAQFDALRERGAAFDRQFLASGLSPARRFMLAHAIHSYYGSTEFLDASGEPFWIVNEGEYRMMNTFDLTVDQLFFEMRLNPWTVANELHWFGKRYAYRDTVRFPGDPTEHPGGLSFSHDMGLCNHLSRPGHSVYEKAGIHGCFSHMTCEELVNWLVCALVYENQTRDPAWLAANLPTFLDCLDSLINRDHPDPDLRNGVMSLDSSRCLGGGEITTYDSLDVSLGQARHNLYLAVKCWGVYVGLEALLLRAGASAPAAAARLQADRCAATLAAAAGPDGLLPAVLFENVPSRIIPAIEGLVIPHALGLAHALDENGPYRPLLLALRRHLAGILQPGICLFPDGGWKISSTSDNSWLSKVYLCQFVSERVLGLPVDNSADTAHAAWLTDPRNLYWAWSDQIVNGEAKGSKYYPRGVTSILWLD